MRTTIFVLHLNLEMLIQREILQPLHPGILLFARLARRQYERTDY